MSYVNMGSMPCTVMVSRDPDRSGNFVCDGTADDVEIQAAITYTSIIGGEVKLLQGQFNISTPITIGSRCVYLSGTGPASILRLSNGVNDHVIKIGTAHRLHLHNFAIDGNKDNNTGNIDGIHTTGPVDTSDDAIWTELGISKPDGARHFGRIDKLWIYNVRRHGMYIDWFKHGTITNCSIATCGGDGIHFDHGAHTLSISNNNYDWLDGNGIFCLEPLSCTIQSNVIAHCYAGIRLNGDAGTKHCDNVVVDGNVIVANDRWGILLLDAHYNIISNNYLKGNSQEKNNSYSAIYLLAQAGAPATHNFIIGNLIVEPWGNKAKYGIEEKAGDGCDYNTIIGNSITGPVSGIVSITGANDRFASKPFQFIKELNSDYRTTSPTGVEVNAATEAGILQGHIPIEAQQVVRIRIFAVALGAPIGAGGQMHLEITFNAGARNAAYNTATKSWSLANFDGEEADYVVNDVVTWVIEDGDVGNELRNLAALDKFELIVTYEDGADPDGATNAVFGSMCIEYV